MSCDELISYLKKKNQYVETSLVDGFISQNLIKYLPLYVIEYCVINEKAQRIIMNLSEKELKLLSQIINYAENKNQDWITLSADFIHLLENAKYTSLLKEINDFGIEDELIPNFIFLTNNNGNFYNVQSINDIRSMDLLRKEKVECYIHTNDPNIILLIKYGISYDKAFNYYKRYGKDVDKLPCSDEKEFLLDIKNIIEGKGTTERVNTNLDLLNNLDSKLRNYFAMIYNESLYKVNNNSFLGNVEKNNVLIPIYDAGTDFTMSIYSYGMATDLKIPENYAEDWLRPEISVDYMCNSIINSLSMRTSIKHCVYGFSSFTSNDLALLSANDLGTGGIYNETNVTNPYYEDKLIADVEFRVPEELSNNTRISNNEVYRKRRRINNGKLEKIVPDYIVYFKTTPEFEDDRVWKESVDAAADFQIPIVIIDCEKCLCSNIEKIDIMLENFESRYDDINSIQKIIEMINSLRYGYEFAPQLLDKYLNTEKLYSYVYRITAHIEEIAAIAPTVALNGIDIFLNTLDDEYRKVLKSPHWVEAAREKGYSIDRPNDIINYLEQLRVKISSSSELKK